MCGEEGSLEMRGGVYLETGKIVYKKKTGSAQGLWGGVGQSLLIPCICVFLDTTSEEGDQAKELDREIAGYL